MWFTVYDPVLGGFVQACFSVSTLYVCVCEWVSIIKTTCQTGAVAESTSSKQPDLTAAFGTFTAEKSVSVGFINYLRELSGVRPFRHTRQDSQSFRLQARSNHSVVSHQAPRNASSAPQLGKFEQLCGEREAMKLFCLGLVLFAARRPFKRDVVFLLTFQWEFLKLPDRDS